MEHIKKFNEKDLWDTISHAYDYVTRETDIPTGKGGYMTRQEEERHKKWARGENLPYKKDVETLPKKDDDDDVKILQKLKSLLDKELITQEEYNSKKKEILDRM